MEISDEHCANGAEVDHAGDVARYEQLRRRALCGDADGWRAGLAVLQTRGVAAWLHTWCSVGVPPPPPAPVRPGVPSEAADRLVAALASMALCSLARA